MVDRAPATGDQGTKYCQHGFSSLIYKSFRYSGPQHRVAQLDSRIDTGNQALLDNTIEEDVAVTSNTDTRPSMSPFITNPQQRLPGTPLAQPARTLGCSSNASKVIGHLEGDTNHFPSHENNQVDASARVRRRSTRYQQGSHLQADLQPRHLHAPVTAVNAMDPSSTSTGHDFGPMPPGTDSRSVTAPSVHAVDMSSERSDLISSIFVHDNLPRLLFAWSVFRVLMSARRLLILAM